MSLAFLTHNNDEREAMDIDITTKNTFVNLIDSIDQPQGVHKIKTTLFSLFPFQNYVNFNHLPKNPQTMTMNLLAIELQPSF